MIAVTWIDDSQRVILYQFQRGWSWDDLYAAESQSLEMAASVAPRPVHFVLDLSDSQIIPQNALSHINIVMKRQPSNLASIMFIGANAFVRVLVNMMERLQLNNKIPMIYVNSEKELATRIETINGTDSASQ